jgi:transcriptional regulator with XRE-family HTH domain
MEALAMLAGISVAHLGRIETGSATAQPIVVVQMARALGVGARRMQAICAASAEGTTEAST